MTAIAVIGFLFTAVSRKVVPLCDIIARLHKVHL